MPVKTLALLAMLTCSLQHVYAQGCSDAGFCTMGNYNSISADVIKNRTNKSDVDFLIIYGTHGKSEKYRQIQLNYRYHLTNSRFFELRLPFNSAKNISSGLSKRGIGDLTLSYNDKLSLIRKHSIDYSLGLRVSLSAANRGVLKDRISYPMYLQNGLGTTDVIAVLNYHVFKYVSAGTGIQLPVVQYNRNSSVLITNAGADVTGKGYRRKADALLRISGHYGEHKFRSSGGILAIFHLADDYYNTFDGRYILRGSKGTTVNWNVELGYALTKKWLVNLLYAEPLKTRTNIPDGLARSRITSMKVTCSF